MSRAVLRGQARQLAAGAAPGVAAHLVRLATGGGPLLWPLPRDSMAVPLWLEAAPCSARWPRAPNVRAPSVDTAGR